MTLIVAIVAEAILRKTRLLGAVIVLAGFTLAGGFVLAQGGTEVLVFGTMVAVDPLATFFKIIILVSAILIVVFSLSSSELQPAGRTLGEYYALLAGLTLGMVLMAGASNLLMMYLAIELSSISSYILAGYTREAPDASEASLKYVIYGALSSGLMLYGISVLYGLTGSLDLYTINRVLASGGINDVTLLVAGVLVLAGFGYKISAVPFHFWTPDVYEGAPITITAFLSVASKAGGFALLLRFFKVSFVDTATSGAEPGVWESIGGFDWPAIIAMLSVLTMTLGNLVAVWQNNMKRLLAYSSIAQAGYMLMGVVVLSNEGLSAIMIYFAAYLFMNLGAFYVVMLVANVTGSEDVEDYKGMAARSPFMAFSLSVFLISLTGLPPTVGFVGKLYLFAALLDQAWIWLAVVGALNSVISLYYYVKVIRNMYLRAGEGSMTAITIGGAQMATMVVLLVPTILLGLYFAPLAELAQASVRIIGTP
jgi:NADH-quinone oxidoreductase subunit N